MKVEEMALRSEIRQMLNEAGFNRETIKEMVKDSINTIVKNQVNQVLMERKEKDFGEVVSAYSERRLHDLIKSTSENVIRDKLRWMKFDVNVNVYNGAENEDVNVNTHDEDKEEDKDDEGTESLHHPWLQITDRGDSIKYL